VEIEYVNGEKEILELKPLNWEDINDLMMIGKVFSKNTENPMENLNVETVELMKKLVLKTMKLSYPEEPEDELKGFATKNFMVLMPYIFEMNFNLAKTEKMERIKEIQKRVRDNAGKVQADKTT